MKLNRKHLGSAVSVQMKKTATISFLRKIFGLHLRAHIHKLSPWIWLSQPQRLVIAEKKLNIAETKKIRIGKKTLENIFSFFFLES